MKILFWIWMFGDSRKPQPYWSTVLEDACSCLYSYIADKKLLDSQERAIQRDTYKNLSKNIIGQHRSLLKIKRQNTGNRASYSNYCVMLYNAVVITMNFCCHTQKMFHQEINFEANTLCWRCYLYVLRRERYFFTKLLEEHWKLTGEWISPLSSKSSPPLESLNPLQAIMVCPSSLPPPLVAVTHLLLQAPFPQFMALFQPQSSPARETDFRSSPLPQLLQNQSPCLIPGSVTDRLL